MKIDQDNIKHEDEYSSAKGSRLHTMVSTIKVGQSFVVNAKSDKDVKKLRAQLKHLESSLGFKFKTKAVERGGFDIRVWRIS